MAQETIIDAGCMKLVQNPDRMDVLLMDNLYGDEWVVGLTRALQ